MEIYFRKKNIKIDAKKARYFERGVGLMFRTRETRNLLFEFEKDSNTELTSLFVFFSFLVIWLDAKNKVIDFKIVKPFIFSIEAKKKFRKFLEIPINKKNERIVDLFVKKS